MLVEMAQERDRPLLPAMIYSTTSAYIAVTRRGGTPTQSEADAIPLNDASPMTSSPTEKAPLMNGAAASFPMAGPSDTGESLFTKSSL